MSFTRREGDLERTYLEAFDRFATMIAEGSFPFEVDEIEVESAPRVGDGVIVIDDETRVRVREPERGELAASPGHPHLRARPACSPTSASTTPRARARCALRLPVAEEIERDEVSVLTQVLPQLEQASAVGAVILLRDVSDLRRRDRLLLSKDATIREIHHRVKNNLQTIASLLRLQARRLRSPEARAALGGIRAADPFDRDRARDAVARTRRHRALQRDRATARAPRRGHGVVARAADPVQRRGRRRRPPGRGRDAARGRAQRAHAERGRPRVPRGRHETRRCRCSSGATTITSSSRSSTTARACPSGSRSRVAQGLGLSIVQALVTGELGGSIEMHSDDGTDGARARAGRDAPSRVVDGREVRSASADARLRSWSPTTLAQPAALFFGEAAPHAGFLVGARARTRGIRPSPGTARRRAWRHRSGRARTPVVPIGKNKLRTRVATGGAVSATRPRPSRASESTSTPLQFPLRWVAQPCVSCAPDHKRVRSPLPGIPQRDVGRVTGRIGAPCKGPDQDIRCQKWNMLRCSSCRVSLAVRWRRVRSSSPTAGRAAVRRENTVAAFAAARELGADGVELDVRRTADGVLVVHHDSRADGLGLLAELPFAEIRAARARGCRRSPKRSRRARACS